MKYSIQVILFIIVFYASWMAKKQFRKAIEKDTYELGLHYKLKPLYGEQARKKAKQGLLIANISPWVLIILLLLYNYLERT